MTEYKYRHLITQPRQHLLSLHSGLIDRERGQAMLRVVAVAIVAIYLLFSFGSIAHFSPYFLLAYGATGIYSIAMWIHTLRAKHFSPLRRLLNNVVDATVLGYMMIHTGEVGAVLSALYVWVTIGNGFRFGNKALAISTILNLISFSIVVNVSDFWQQHPKFSASVFFTLIVIPIYAAHLINMLNAALKRAEEANAAKGRFLARMSHELRTPLNGIVGAVELLSNSRRLGAEERPLLQTIRDSVEVSLSQINNILDFSKIEAGKLVLERTNLDLHEVVCAAANMVRPAATQKGLRYFVRIAPELPYRLVGDPHHLRAILLNLLSNAAKFTEQGWICLDVSGREEPNGKVVVRFEIRDTGIGIAPEAQQRIFESFAQEDSGTTRRYGGTGLGTSIAKQLVELMGGKIGVESVKGQGSTFWFEIPFDPQARAGDRFVETLPGVRALLLTEDLELLQHYRRTVEGLQGQLVHARSAEEAVEGLARSLRVGNLIHAVMVDAALAVGNHGEHLQAGLCEKANAANVSVFLIADDPPTPDVQREWGYSGVLGQRAAAPLVHAALHASPVRLAALGPGVVSLPPWIWKRRGGERPRILVADDNRTNLMIVRRMLEQGGYDVDAVETGDEALERLCAGGYRAAVLDMHMPEMDGIMVLRRYRSLRPQSRLPVIVLTANATLEAQQECAEAGADAYLAKPVTTAQLLGELERLVHDTEVTALAAHPAAARSKQAEQVQPAEDGVVIETGVLAELDRLYDDPRELARVIGEYEAEGRALIEKAAQACATRNYAAFCDILHALKGNAANVGAVKLAQICREAEAVGMVAFLRERERMFVRLQDAFAESLSALHGLVRATANAGGGHGSTVGH